MFLGVDVPINSAASPRPTNTYCITLEAWFLTALLGYADILAYDAAWDGTPEQIAAATEAVREQVLALMTQTCCEGVAAIRTNKAGYMVSIDQDGNVTILGDTYDAAQVEGFPSEQPVDLPGDNICAGSRLLVERLLSDVMFSLDQAQFMVDGFKTGTEAASLITKTIPLFNITMGELFDAWQEWVLSAASLTISTLKIAFGDPAVKDKMVENIYCKTMDTANRMFTESTYFESLQDVPLLESQSSILARFLAGFEVVPSGDIFATAKRWFLLGALNEDNTCEVEFTCDPGWILECDLTISDGGLEVAPGVADGGVYVPGVGWEDTLQINSGYYHRNIALKTDFPEAQYTGAGMDFTYTQGTMALDGGAYWVLEAGGHYFGIIPNLSTPPESPWNATGSEHTGTEVAYYIPVGLTEGGGDPGGTATLTRVRLYGIGTPPIIEGWVLV